MQDPRIRLLATVFLSCAAWISLPGAILTMLWWIVWGKTTSIRSIKTLLLFLLIPAVMSVAAAFSGGNGLSYFFRITSVFIIASWMYAERYPGELLDVGVYFAGIKIGFDLGLIGEMSMSALTVMAKETERISIALRQKETHLTPAIVPAVFSGFLVRQLQLAQDRATLLVLRGYTRGGNHCPSFTSSWKEQVAGAFSCVIFLFSLFAGEFFIIYGSTFIV